MLRPVRSRQRHPHVALAIGLLVQATLCPSSAIAQSAAVGDAEIMRLVGRHCAMCHSQNPSHTMLMGQPPPKGVVLESVDDVRRLADRILGQVVKGKAMPFGNETAMTPEERAAFAAWLTGK